MRLRVAHSKMQASSVALRLDNRPAVDSVTADHRVVASNVSPIRVTEAGREDG
jgi:hypothetical protein